jgi:hypothetical protein
MLITPPAKSISQTFSGSATTVTPPSNSMSTKTLSTCEFVGGMERMSARSSFHTRKSVSEKKKKQLGASALQDAYPLSFRVPSVEEDAYPLSFRVPSVEEILQQLSQQEEWLHLVHSRRAALRHSVCVCVCVCVCAVCVCE